MTENVLLRFLKHGLIDVGGDDAKLEKLQAASGDLASLLKKAPSKAAAYALIAFDPYAPAEDPVVREALEALNKRWATYANTFSGKPIAVVRAMLLDALATAAKEDERVGVAFATSARNTLPFMEAGDEQAIWSDVVAAIEEQVDTRAEAEWSMPDSITMSPMTFDLPAIKAPLINVAQTNQDYLTKALRAAAGPTSQEEGKNVPTQGNPHWPQQNQAWVGEFGIRASQAIAETFDDVVSQTTVEQTDLSEPFHALTISISEYLSATLTTISGATAGLQRRTNLLWWKEALYSPSARGSYRNLPPSVAATLMAFDLHQQVPNFSPASVSAFLFEAVTSLPSSDKGKMFSIRDLAVEAQTHESLAALRNAGSELISFSDGRGPVMALIAYPDSPSAQSEADFRRLTGVPADTQVSLPAWSTWVFRELQTARVTATPVKSRRRSRKA